MWNKTKRAMDVMKERNRRYLESQKAPADSEKQGETPADPEKDAENRAPELTDDMTPEEKAEAFHRDDEIKLEKGDLPALILSALMVFGPIFLVLIAIVVLAWFFLQ